MSESLLAASSEIELIEIPETQKILSKLPWNSSKTFPNGDYTYSGNGLTHSLSIEDGKQTGCEKLEFDESFAILRTFKNGKSSPNLWLLVTSKSPEDEEADIEDKTEAENDPENEDNDEAGEEEEEEDEEDQEQEEDEEMENEEGEDQEEEAEDQDEQDEQVEDQEATTLSEKLQEHVNRASEAIELRKKGVSAEIQDLLKGEEFEELEQGFGEIDFKHLIFIKDARYESLASAVECLGTHIFEKSCFIFSNPAKEDSEYSISFSLPNIASSTTHLYSFNDSGSLKSINLFTKGQLNGLQQSFHRNGKMAEEVTFEEGVECLDKKTFHEDGALNRTTLLLEESEVVKITNFDENQRQTKSSLWRFEEEAEEKECVSFGCFGDVQIASDWKPEQDEGRYLTSIGSARGYLGKREAFAEGLFEADGIDFDLEVEEEIEEGVDLFDKNIDSIYSMTSKEERRIEFIAYSNKRLVLLADKDGKFKKIKYE